MVNQQANLQTISIVDILSTLSDDKAFILYNAIALGGSQNFRTLIKNLGITRHQYYLRIFKMTKAGLIKRENGEYVTTLLGDVVYKAISLVGKGLKYYWVLKAIELFQAPSALNSEEAISALIDSLIEDPDIKEILMDPPIESSGLPQNTEKQKVQKGYPKLLAINQ